MQFFSEEEKYKVERHKDLLKKWIVPDKSDDSSSEEQYFDDYDSDDYNELNFDHFS